MPPLLTAHGSPLGAGGEGGGEKEEDVSTNTVEMQDRWTTRPSHERRDIPSQTHHSDSRHSPRPVVAIAIKRNR